MPAFNLDFALWSSVYIILQGSQGAYAVFVVYYESWAWKKPNPFDQSCWKHSEYIADHADDNSYV